MKYELTPKDIEVIHTFLETEILIAGRTGIGCTNTRLRCTKCHFEAGTECKLTNSDIKEKLPEYYI